MKNNICIPCDGKGFNWVSAGEIVRHDGKKVVANLHKPGPKCETCNGTGERPKLGCGNMLVLAVMALVFFAFFANPLGHWISSLGQ